MFRHPGLFAVRLMAVRLLAVWLFAIRLMADGGLAFCCLVDGCPAFCCLALALASGGILCGPLSCQVVPAQHKASHVPPSPARFNRCPERRAALVEA